MSCVFSSSGCAATKSALPSSRKARISCKIAEADGGFSANPLLSKASKTQETRSERQKAREWRRFISTNGARNLANHRASAAAARTANARLRQECINRMDVRYVRYFFTVNGAENCVFSHIIFSVPPP